MGRKGYDKEYILEKGLEVMYRNGYNGTGIQEIVNAAGIPKGSFYSQFKSKEEFLISALELYIKRTFEDVGELLTDKSVSPINRLKNLFQSRLEILESEKMQHLGCFAGNICQEMAGHSETVSKKVDDAFNTFKNSMARCIKEAQKEGEVSGDKNPEVIAEVICNSFQGALLRMKSNGSLKPLHDLKEVIFDMILK